MKLMYVLFKIIASISIALPVLLYVIQEDPWCKVMLEKKFVTLMQSFDAELAAQVKSIDIASVKINLEQINAQPRVGERVWAWGCQKCTLQVSLWQLLRKGTLEFTGSASDFSIFSVFDGQNLAIVEHVKKLFSSPFVVPITLNNLSIHHGFLDIYDKAASPMACVAYNSRTSMVGPKCKTAISFTRGELAGLDSLRDLGGQLECDIITRPSGLDVQGNTQISFTLSSLPEEQNKFVFSASAKDGGGYFDIHNDEHTLGGSITTVGQSLIARLSGVIPIEYIEALLYSGNPFDSQGLMTVQGEADLYDFDNFARAQLTIDEPGFGSWKIKKATGQLEKSSGVYQGSFKINIDDQSNLRGTSKFDFKKIGGELNLQGTFFDSAFSNAFQEIDCVINVSEKKINGLCSIFDTDDHQYASPLLKATIEGAPDDLWMHGTASKKTFSLKGSLAPEVSLTSFMLNDEHNQPLINLVADKSTLAGSLDVQVLKGLTKNLAGLSVNGEGAIEVYAEKTDQGAQGSLSFSGGLRLPILYNGITHMSAEWDASFADYSVKLQDVAIGLHKGYLSSKEISVSLDEWGHLDYLQAPLSLRDCFISHHKDFFAILSGDCSIEQQNGLTQITGDLSIDRSHLKGNLLAGQVHSDVLIPFSRTSPMQAMADSVALDLNVTTKEPLKVKTPFLQTSATINASIKGELPNVEGSGAIELKGGSLSFPFKPLYITSGKIMLMPQELDDPEIELHAKNTLKKYTVSVLATGTAKKPKITFNASPQLSEEQIITLLCTGSEDAGLLSAVPSVIMHNIQQLIFGPADEASTFTKYLKKIFRPFGSIRVVPTIGENKDHSGLHASVEVDINERIHGSVRKNLNTQEDTKVELEYALSDEMSIRGTKDERGDVSAEVEFRFNL